jgi:hypothetical protein
VLRPRSRIVAVVVALGAIAVVSSFFIAATPSGGKRAPTVKQPRLAGLLQNPIDPNQQLAVAFEQRSHWLQPWRAYLDTFPASRLLSAIGVNFNVAPGEAEATARLLASAGIRRARVELSWGSFRYDDPTALAQPARYRTVLRALKRHGIRPLILLTTHHGLPTPVRVSDVTLEAPARTGATSVRLSPESATIVVPGRTGLDNVEDVYKAAEVLFTGVSPDGIATLSRPLTRDLPAGPQRAATLLYAPFQRPVKGGSPNPAFEETFAGWLQYVDAATRVTREILGSADFDVEIWNELSFGSDFLDVNSYYEPDMDAGQGDVTDAVLRRTVQFLREPGRGLGSVGIANGFASQRPWDAGSTSPPGLTAISKHPYQGRRTFPDDRFDGSLPLDAQGQPDGNADPTVKWRDRFVPSYVAFLPEYYLTAIQTEHLIRDLSPHESEVFGVRHGRETRPDGAFPPAVWLTEWNIDPAGSAEGSSDRPLSGGERALQAKAVLRGLVSYVGKGATAIYLYAAKDNRLGIISPSFFRSLARSKKAARGGLTIDALARLVSAFRGAAPISSPRQLSLISIGDVEGHVQFQGDGTAAHPPLYNRDVVAFFPFQVTGRRFVIATYVMTRDIARGLPAERYMLSIGNLGSCSVSATATDPLTNGPVSIRVASCSPEELVVEVPLTDSPRLLTLDLATRG